MTAFLKNTLSLYESLHQNNINKAIHWIAVPLCLFFLVGMLYALPFPFIHNSYINWATILGAIIIIYYAQLSMKVAIGFIFIIASLTLLNVQWAYFTFFSQPQYFIFSLIGFIIAYISLIIGHKIEGEMPITFKGDFRFLIVGPTWYLCFFYDKLGVKY